MPIASMTGFARRNGAIQLEGELAEYSWSWEIKTVNARNLDVKFRLPPLLDQIEPKIRQIIARRLSRGSCQLQLQFTRNGPQAGPRINEDLLREIYARLNDLGQSLRAEPIPLAAILSIRGVVDFEERSVRPDELAPIEAAVLADFEPLLESLVSMRCDEGSALLLVLRQRAAEISSLVRQADVAPGRQPEMVRRRLEFTIAALLEAAPALDQQRLHQEAVLIAARADIREEIDRLDAHVVAIDKLLDQGGPVGRRLDFLAQEMTREANTLCAKSNDVTLTGIGLELKTIVEQFREQVQNVE